MLLHLKCKQLFNARYTLTRLISQPCACKKRFLSISNYCRYAIISNYAVGNIHECLNLTEPLMCNITYILTRFTNLNKDSVYSAFKYSDDRPYFINLGANEYIQPLPSLVMVFQKHATINFEVSHMK